VKYASSSAGVEGSAPAVGKKRKKNEHYISSYDAASKTILTCFDFTVKRESDLSEKMKRFDFTVYITKLSKQFVRYFDAFWIQRGKKGNSW